MGKLEQMFEQAKLKEQQRKGTVPPPPPNGQPAGQSIIVRSKSGSQASGVTFTLVSPRERWDTINKRLIVLGDAYNFCVEKNPDLPRLFSEAEKKCLFAIGANDVEEFDRLLAMYLKTWGSLCEAYLIEKERDGSIQVALLSLHLFGVKFNGAQGERKEGGFFYREVPLLLLKDLPWIKHMKEIKEVFPGAEIVSVEIQI